MRILLADSDRDLLQSYRKLLSMDGHEVVTAFDGPQVVSGLGKGPYDLAILEESLPRMEHEEMLRLFKEAGAPVIVLTDGRVTVRHLLRPALPNAYLPFPFLPEDLTRLMERVVEKKRSGGTIPCGGAEVDVSGFCFAGTSVRLTDGEIDLLDDLKQQKRVTGKRARTLIQAVNEKLRGMGKDTRIVYELEKGYRMVNGHE